MQSPTDSLKRRAEELVGQVKKLLNNDANYKDHELDLLNLIDSLQRLGIGYHFEDEIDERLKALLIRNDDGKDRGVDDLHAVALKFRLLRQQGYHAASDVFSKYREAEGKFKMDLAEDVRGLLSLYEACFWATHENDSILDESLSFSKHHLQEYINEAEGIDSALKKLVSHALEIPLQRGIPRSEARFYLSIYEHDIPEEEQIDIVLELSKLDYHLVQLLHREEARSLTFLSKRDTA